MVKKVLNTQSYQYLWLTIWFHTSKSKEMLKKTKSLILLYKIGSKAQKWLKIAKKTDHSIAIYSIFLIGMVYFRWYLVNPHVQTVQNMYSKGGERVCKAELRPVKVDPYSERKKTFGGVAKTWLAAILTLEQNPPERIFLMYIKISLQRILL